MKRVFTTLLVAAGLFGCGEYTVIKAGATSGVTTTTQSEFHEVTVRVKAEQYAQLNVDSSLKEGIFEMDIQDGEFIFTYRLKAQPEGEHWMFIDDSGTIVVPEFITVNDHQVCQKQGKQFFFTLPLEKDQTCEQTTPFEVKTRNLIGIASLEWGKGGFSSCDQDVAEAIIAAKDWVKYVVVDIEAFSDDACVQVLDQVHEETDLTFAVYVNTQEMFCDITQRPWQYENCQWVINNAPEWFLRDSDGNHMSVWPEMKMINQLIDGPQVNGQYYREWINDRVIKQIQDSGFEHLVSAIHYDNFNYVMEWILANKELDFEIDRWTFDQKNRAGLRAMVDDMRSKKPNWEIHALANTEMFSNDLDCVTYENFLGQDMGSGGMLAHVMQLQNTIASSDICALHHTWVTKPHRDANSTEFEEEFETAYALAQMYGALFSWDAGDAEHGSFYLENLYWDLYLGQPVGPLVEAFDRVYTLEEPMKLTDGQCEIFEGTTQDIVSARYEIIDGVFGQSETKGSISSGEWQTGLRVNDLGSKEICHEGPGYTQLTNLVIYDHETARAMYREFEHGEAFVNVHDDPITVTSKDGEQITIQSGHAKIVLF